jgi:predicted NAD/FAD-dependent oxidoreductase
MSTIASQPSRSEGPMPTEKEVAIVGAGIAGLTCALRLSERGYKVTLYEKKPILGGDLSSEYKNGMYHDVYTHLFCDWYVNFWRIVENDLKIRRDEAFEPRMSVKLLDDPSRQSSAAPHTPDGVNAAAKSTTRAAADIPAQMAGADIQAAFADKNSNNVPSYQDLKNTSTLKNIWDNLVSGALPPPEMFLVGFTLLDLASQPFHRSSLLQQQTVNGFLYSRPYATEDCADLHNTILMEIWCIPSSDTSAAAYKDFVRHGFGSHALPFAWLLRGSLEEMLIKPWQDSLKRAGCEIRTSVEVTAIELGDDHRVQLTLGDKTKASHANVVLAVPAPELAKLVMTGGPGRRVVDRVPALSELGRLRTARILVVTVFFKEKLPNIPREHVGMAGSHGYLTFIDISQLWTSLSNIKDHPTVLILAASDAYAFPSDRDEEWAHMMIRELARYLPAVKPGDSWGASESNIDYAKSWPQNNHSHTLFLNDMNSEEWLVEPCYRDLESVFFAGDFCVNEVKMATVEAATLSGLHAARAVQMKTEGRSDITVAPGVIPTSAELMAMKLALLPVAYGAKAWSTAKVVLRDLAEGPTRTTEGVVEPLTTLALIPLRYVADWVATLETLGVDLLSPGHEPYSSSSTIQEGLRAAARGMVAAGDYLRNRASEQSHQQADKPRDLAALLTAVLKAVNTASSELLTPRATRADSPLGSALAEGGRLLRSSGRYRPGSGYVRRHRAKL